MLCQECTGSSIFNFCFPVLFYKLYFLNCLPVFLPVFFVLLIFYLFACVVPRVCSPGQGWPPIPHSPTWRKKLLFKFYTIFIYHYLYIYFFLFIIHFILLLYIFYIIMYHVSSYMATHPTLSDLKTKKYHILIYFISYIIVNHISSYMGWSPTSFSPTWRQRNIIFWYILYHTSL